MNIYKFNSIKLDIIFEVCQLGIAQYESKEFIDEGNKIVNEILKGRTELLINNQQKQIIGGFLANWYNANKIRFSDLQNKMFDDDYKNNLLILEQNDISKLDNFLDLLKTFNEKFYKDFFVGTNSKNYRKQILNSLLV